eukprot:Cvel_35190.t1-p1 / transcript=Cvel_35190.t1 / gene=Cvel_35190 / organism=Chromera_velia_CCMP2878 / gene_product=hypothetical protein / transcript_product=hypothetical protein / location=Cvel_scaffold6332:1-2977(-) / protein_length=992 / sequence_SO=supercontig / SO=protein_coding / is_pseudo=false
MSPKSPYTFRASGRFSEAPLRSNLPHTSVPFRAALEANGAESFGPHSPERQLNGLSAEGRGRTDFPRSELERKNEGHVEKMEEARDESSGILVKESGEVGPSKGEEMDEEFQKGSQEKGTRGATKGKAKGLEPFLSHAPPSPPLLAGGQRQTEAVPGSLELSRQRETDRWLAAEGESSRTGWSGRKGGSGTREKEGQPREEGGVGKPDEEGEGGPSSSSALAADVSVDSPARSARSALVQAVTIGSPQTEVCVTSTHRRSSRDRIGRGGESLRAPSPVLSNKSSSDSSSVVQLIVSARLQTQRETEKEKEKFDKHERESERRRPAAHVSGDNSVCRLSPSPARRSVSLLPSPSTLLRPLADSHSVSSSHASQGSPTVSSQQAASPTKPGEQARGQTLTESRGRVSMPLSASREDPAPSAPSSSRAQSPGQSREDLLPAERQRTSPDKGKHPRGVHSHSELAKRSPDRPLISSYSNDRYLSISNLSAPSLFQTSSPQRAHQQVRLSTTPSPFVPPPSRPFSCVSVALAFKSTLTEAVRQGAVRGIGVSSLATVNPLASTHNRTTEGISVIVSPPVEQTATENAPSPSRGPPPPPQPWSLPPSKEATLPPTRTWGPGFDSRTRQLTRDAREETAAQRGASREEAGRGMHMVTAMGIGTEDARPSPLPSLSQSHPLPIFRPPPPINFSPPPSLPPRQDTLPADRLENADNLIGRGGTGTSAKGGEGGDNQPSAFVAVRVLSPPLPPHVSEVGLEGTRQNRPQTETCNDVTASLSNSPSLPSSRLVSSPTEAERDRSHTEGQPPTAEEYEGPVTITVTHTGRDCIPTPASHERLNTLSPESRSRKADFNAGKRGSSPIDGHRGSYEVTVKFQPGGVKLSPSRSSLSTQQNSRPPSRPRSREDPGQGRAPSPPSRLQGASLEDLRSPPAETVQSVPPPHRFVSPVSSRNPSPVYFRPPDPSQISQRNSHLGPDFVYTTLSGTHTRSVTGLSPPIPPP